MKGGGGDCNDLAIQRNINTNAHAGIREGKGDLSGGNCEVASKIFNSKIKVKRAQAQEIQVCFHKNMSAEKHSLERERLDCICANETEAQCDARKKKECEQSTMH
jgi:hypothetical protein